MLCPLELFINGVNYRQFFATDFRFGDFDRKVVLFCFVGFVDLIFYLFVLQGGLLEMSYFGLK